jgi:murein DD-endopeptidase MepM/ murein hydrolase activator NlpD
VTPAAGSPQTVIPWAVASVAVALVLVMLPRAVAFSSVFEENTRLKERLDDIDGQMEQVERALLRLRAYEAQLQSLDTEGEHGPIEASAAFQVPDGMDGWLRTPPHAGDLATGRDGDGRLTASVWADGLAARTDTFLRLFEELEPSLNDHLVKAEELWALERALPSVWPADGELTSPFGWRRSPFGTRWRFHSGLDIARNRGAPVLAAADGVVRSSGWDGGFGYAIALDHGLGVSTVYAHCHRLLVEEGARVVAGQRIALMGNTGQSTGPHLHFEVHFDSVPVDPADYLPPR